MDLRIMTAFFAVAAMPQADDTKDKPVKLEGTYTIVSGERDGKPIPDERIKGSVILITADKIAGTDRDKKQLFSSTYKLDATKKPMTLTMKSTPPADEKDKKTSEMPDTPGLVEVDGESIKIIYALPGGAAPKTFKTEVNQHLFVLKKMKAEK